MSRAHRDPVLIAVLMTLLGLQIVHALDHTLRQTAPVPTEASALGTIGFVTTGVALVLAVVGSRWAWAATALIALGTFVGFIAVHVLPDWGPFSQPYSDIPVDALSWVAMLVPALAALAIGAYALRASTARKASPR